jgi:hypothetical protein
MAVPNTITFLSVVKFIVKKYGRQTRNMSCPGHKRMK